jgi:hypothetical protein
MKYHPTLCLDPANTHQVGATSLNQFLQLCGSLALNPQAQTYLDFAQIEPVLKGIGKNQAVLFSVVNYRNSGCAHMVRFDSIVNGQKLRVMCPYFGAASLDEIDWQDLVTGNVTTVVLTRNPF